VLTGSRTAWLPALSRIACEARRTSDAVDVAEFRGALAGCDASVAPLGTSAIGARDVLLARLNVAGAQPRGRVALAQIS